MFISQYIFHYHKFLYNRITELGIPSTEKIIMNFDDRKIVKTRSLEEIGKVIDRKTKNVIIGVSRTAYTTSQEDGVRNFDSIIGRSSPRLAALNRTSLTKFGLTIRFYTVSYNLAELCEEYFMTQLRHIDEKFDLEYQGLGLTYTVEHPNSCMIDKMDFSDNNAGIFYVSFDVTIRALILSPLSVDKPILLKIIQSGSEEKDYMVDNPLLKLNERDHLKKVY